MNIHSLGGQHFYYLESCKRQLWLYLQQINLAGGHEPVELGKFIHEETYKNEKKEIQIGGFKIDFIHKDGYVHETKSSKTIKSKHQSQPLFYAYYLRYVMGFEHIQGAKIHYPLLNRVETIPLDQSAKAMIENKIDQILQIAKEEQMPDVHLNKSLCVKCAYYEFCYA